MAEDEEQRVPIYELHPPKWLPHTSSAGELGYLGFHPPRPGQVEDQLTEHNLKNGLTIPPQVSAETFTALDILKIEDVTLKNIGALIDEVFARQVDSVAAVSQSTFRIPTRVTLNDAKRHAWFADLANPDVPLQKLGKSVPHGAKGHDLLDLLQSNNVAIPRAVWFLRVFGANETAGLRNKPSYNPTQYSIDWANMVTSYLKKQLAEIILPSAPRAGLNIKQTFKGVLSDSDTRERWIARFTYCLRLLRTFYSEGLVDHRTFLVWTVHQMATCNLAQAGFITRLSDEYFAGIIGSHALARPFVDSCLAKLVEIESSSAQEYLIETEDLLKTLLKRLFIAFPDAFISPRMWKAHSQLLMDLVEEDIIPDSAAKHVQQNSRNIQDILRSNLADIHRRNESMLFRCHPAQRSMQLGPDIEYIQLLNNISSTTVMNDLHFFSQSTHNKASFVRKLDMLLTWAVTPFQYGEHRSFAAATLLRGWRNDACDRASRREFGTPSEFLQDQLFDWLDTSEIANEPDNLRAVSVLYGKLVRHDLFSYSNYIQRLIARGEKLIQAEDSAGSRHGKFLRWIPLFPSNSSLTNQRKVTLYGARAREIPEDVNEREIRRELRQALPSVFDGESSIPQTTAALLECCRCLTESPRYEQIRTLHLWLLPLLKRYIASHERDPASLLSAYSVSLELMDHAHCYHSILDLTISILEHASSVELVTAVINTFHTYSTTWACMNEMGRIVTALEGAYHGWKARGVQCRPLLSLLLEFDNGRYLGLQSRHQITADITAFTMALQPGTEGMDIVPNVLPEILLLADDADPDAPSILANSLWIKYRTSPHWAWKVWDNTIASLRQLSAMTSDKEEQHRCAIRYGTFLCHVDQHIAFGLDGEVLDWLTGPGKNEVSALTSETWGVLIAAILHICVFGAVKTTTILEGFIYPVWLQAAALSMDVDDSNIDSWLHAANELFQRLLLMEEVNEDSLSPVNLLELQSIRSRRQDVYRSDSFPRLVSKIPVMVLIEKNEHLSAGIREEIAQIRRNLSLKSQFRQAAYRNLEAVRSAFEEPLNETLSGDSFNKQLIDGLALLFHNPGQDHNPSDWLALKSLLSPWKIAASMVELQLVLKQLGRDLASDTGRWSASTTLDKLSTSLLQHAISRDEAFYVGEMMKGVDPLVVGRFLDNGIKQIADVLKSPQSKPSDRLQKAGDLLHVLIYVAETTWNTLNKFSPDIDSTKQSSFLAALLSHLPPAQPTPSTPEAEKHQYALDLAIVLRLLQFQLGFGSNWNVEIKELSNKFANSLFKLALVHGTSEELVDPATYSVVIDTLYYLYDEIPCDPKTVPYDPFRHYPNLSPQELPPDLPASYRQQLLCFLPRFPATAAVTNLINSHRDSNGNLIYGSQVVNQPWEWIENLGEAQPADSKPASAKVGSKHEVRNTGSLSLQLFEARVTGDTVLQDSCGEDKLRSFESGLSAEPVFKRDWRETRIDCETAARVLSGAPAEYDSSGTSYQQGMTRPDRRPTPNHSPSSTVSRTPTGTRNSGNSGRQSPAPRSAGKKRKVIEVPDDDDDDEVEIVEDPHPVRPDPKKQKPRTASKTKAKKR